MRNPDLYNMYHFIQPVEKLSHVTLYLGLNGLLYRCQRNLTFPSHL